MITAEQVGRSVPLDMLEVANRGQLEAEGVSGVQIGDQDHVSEQPAYILTCHPTVNSGKASFRHAIFVTQSYARHVSLLATRATTADAVQTFDVMFIRSNARQRHFPYMWVAGPGGYADNEE